MTIIDRSLQARHTGSDGIRELMQKLPHHIQKVCMTYHETEKVEEIVLDINKPLWVITTKGGPHQIPEIVVNELEMENFLSKIGTIKDDNRTGIEGTLHRISVIRDRDSQKIIGITVRFGIPIFHIAEPLLPELEKVNGMMVIGPPAKGKTTLLRDIIRISGSIIDPGTGFVIGPRIVVVDTSGDIGGHGIMTHPALGSARRIPVPDPATQTKLIHQAIGNHSPIIVVVDEIRNTMEAEALATSAKRGVKPIATCHGEQLTETVENPTFWSVLGDIAIDPVTRRRRRYSNPIFGTATEVWDKGLYAVHPDLVESIDRVMEGKLPNVRLVGPWTDEQSARMAMSVKNRIEQNRRSMMSTREIDEMINH